MTKKEVKKKGYQEIIKNKREHQEVYEELKTTRPAFNKTIAEQLTLIPSASVREKWKTWIYIYIILLGFMAILRIGTMISLLDTNIPPAALLIAGVLALVLPGIGIFGAIKYKLELLRSTSIVIALFAIRSLNKITYDSGTLIGLALVAIIIILGFVLPSMMKTSYTTAIIKKDHNGKTIIDYDIQFDKGHLINDELLDSNI